MIRSIKLDWPQTRAARLPRCCTAPASATTREALVAVAKKKTKEEEETGQLEEKEGE